MESSTDIAHYSAELGAVRREFEVFKMEINYQRARTQRVEAYVEDDREGSEAPSLKVITQIYEGTWQQQGPPARRNCTLHWQ